MRKILNLIVFGLLTGNTLNGFTQADKMDLVFDWQNNKKYMRISVDSIIGKFSPTVDEIKLAKELSIKYTDSLELTRDPKILTKIGTILKYENTDYFRQYVGYIDKNGAKIIFINACCTVSPPFFRQLIKRI